jgi:flavin reductase (DIM6/NTAB) family NADH-FMN oxidoreductase RutF
MTDAAQPTADEFRATLGLFATGVAVVSARVGDLAHGMTANAIASVSLDPLLVLVCVERDAIMRKVIDEVGGFSLSVLAADQEHLSRWFADPVRPNGSAQFDGIGHHPAPVSGAPLLDGAIAWIDCTLDASQQAGDHVIFIGRVRWLGRGGGEPLIYFGSHYRELAERTR